MHRIASQLLILLIPLCISLEGASQDVPEFSVPILTLDNDILQISYDILKSDPGDLFTITLEVTDQVDNPIIPKSLSGDVGNQINGGRNKVIKWDLKADKISMNQIITVGLVGERINKMEAGTGNVRISTLGAVGRSVVFPGWGLSKINTGQPHWIKGAIGYGALSGALLFNRWSINNYENYLDSNIDTERTAYYNRSLNQELTSVILAFSAVGIWVTEMVWTTIAASKKPRYALEAGLDYRSTAPILIFTYRF